MIERIAQDEPTATRLDSSNIKALVAIQDLYPSDSPYRAKVEQLEREGVEMSGVKAFLNHSIFDSELKPAKDKLSLFERMLESKLARRQVLF